VEGVVGGSSGLAAAALFQHGNGSMILITPTAEAAELIAEDITLFLNEPRAGGTGAGDGQRAGGVSPPVTNNVLLFPPMTQHDDVSESALAITDESFGDRVNVLKWLTANAHHRFLIVVSMPALLQPVPPPELLKKRTQTLSVNSRVDIELLRRSLVEGGYHSTSAVDLPGEFAVRGYILDLFAPDWEQPVRIEFFNDEIESIRRFDLATQRSMEKLSEIDLTRLQPYESTGASLLDYVSSTTPIVLVEPSAMQERCVNILWESGARAGDLSPPFESSR